MSSLLKKELGFLRLLLRTGTKQQRALLKTIQPSQLRAIVQVVYNVLMGTRQLSPGNKKLMQRYKRIIRRFVSKELSPEQRKRILLKYFQYLKPALALVLEEF